MAATRVFPGGLPNPMGIVGTLGTASVTLVNTWERGARLAQRPMLTEGYWERRPTQEWPQRLA